MKSSSSSLYKYSIEEIERACDQLGLKLHLTTWQSDLSGWYQCEPIRPKPRYFVKIGENQHSMRDIRFVDKHTAYIDAIQSNKKLLHVLKINHARDMIDSKTLPVINDTLTQPTRRL